MTSPGNGFTVKEIVLEIRHDLKELRDKVDAIDRQGSIGTRVELADHERRIRRGERWMYSLPGVAAFTAVAFLLNLLGIIH